MARRYSFLYLDTTKNAFDFSMIESTFLSFGYHLENIHQSDNPVVIIADEHQDDCGMPHDFTRKQFDDYLVEKKDMLFHWYGEEQDTIIDAAVWFTPVSCRFYISLSGWNDEDELRLIRLFFKLAHIFAEREELIGCMLDTRDNYLVYDLDDLFLRKIFKENAIDYNGDFTSAERERFCGFLPPVFGIRLDQVAELMPTPSWLQAKIVGNVLLLFNPATAQTYHREPFSLDDIL